jgi:uncharacterized membrane protein YgaE (UPF0421/DUF939 family)
MGYTTNVALAIPMAIIIYMLTEKTILATVADKKFADKVQSNFVIGFVTGLTYIALAMTAFAQQGVFDNQALQLAMYGAGGFMVLNSVFFSWDILDEQTKIVILGISIAGLVVWSFTQQRSRSKKIDKKNKKSKSNLKSKKRIE